MHEQRPGPVVCACVSVWVQEDGPKLPDRQGERRTPCTRRQLCASGSEDNAVWPKRVSGPHPESGPAASPAALAHSSHTSSGGREGPVSSCAQCLGPRCMGPLCVCSCEFCSVAHTLPDECPPLFQRDDRWGHRRGTRGSQGHGHRLNVSAQFTAHSGADDIATPSGLGSHHLCVCTCVYVHMPVCTYVHVCACVRVCARVESFLLEV